MVTYPLKSHMSPLSILYVCFALELRKPYLNVITSNSLEFKWRFIHFTVVWILIKSLSYFCHLTIPLQKKIFLVRYWKDNIVCRRLAWCMANLGSVTGIPIWSLDFSQVLSEVLTVSRAKSKPWTLPGLSKGKNTSVPNIETGNPSFYCHL